MTPVFLVKTSGKMSLMFQTHFVASEEVSTLCDVIGTCLGQFCRHRWAFGGLAHQIEI